MYVALVFPDHQANRPYQSHHALQIYEQSRLANETGAAVHLAPNANGLLRRWGIYAEAFGANPLHHFKERDLRNQGGFDVDVRKSQGQWQHPWQLVHRAYLHSEIRKVATGEDDGVSPPAKVHVGSKVVGANPEKGELHLEDGTTVQADVILGADGIYVSPDALLGTPLIPILTGVHSI